ncbi:MAG: hypothetical protein ABGX16_18805, partial [Pirellulales bacterium]
QWQRFYGMTSGGSQSMGDLDGDADVDHYDSWILRRNLGMIATTDIQANAIQAATLQVPEPTVIGLIIIGFWVLLGLARIFHPFLLRRPKSFRGCVMFRPRAPRRSCGRLKV